MARTYTNVPVAIWDEAFCALSPGAQRTYFMLITQGEITACGSLALTLRRWAQTVPDKYRAEVGDWLEELQDVGIVFIDDDTEELLVRTFVASDGGYRHSKRVLAVISTANAIRSVRLRKTIIEELVRLRVLPDASGEPEPDPVRTGSPPDSQSTGKTDSQSIPTPQATEVGRVVVTLGDHKSTPQTAKLKPQSGGIPPQSNGTRSAPTAADRTPAPLSDTRAIIESWRTSLRKPPPEAVIGQVSTQVVRMIGDGINPADVARGLAAWQDKGDLAPSVLPSVVHEVMNGPPNGKRPRAQKETDDIFDRASERMGVNK